MPKARYRTKVLWKRRVPKDRFFASPGPVSDYYFFQNHTDESVVITVTRRERVTYRKRGKNAKV